jgi:hypothetical protein
MVLGKLRGLPSPKPPPRKPVESGPVGLVAVLARGITLTPDRLALLKEGVTKGLEFFENFNDSRLKLAFSSFDEDMKKALYEVLYLLHVNDPSFAEFRFTGIKRERERAMVRGTPFETTANLYVEGAPHGVQGIDQLSPVFREQFETYVRATFPIPPAPQSTYGWSPIVSIHSLGSIGTIGHKSRASDLDLQVQYELEPFLFDTRGWSDATFREAMRKEQEALVSRLRHQQGLAPNALQDPKVKEELLANARTMVAKSYPLTFRYLFGESGAAQELLASQEPGLHGKIVHELMQLMKRFTRLTQGEELKQREALLKQRIQAIQNYLFEKFPHVEIYLFSSSNDDYRRGYHGTTLESKEASGSAYQLILNYETLMPGIQLTPMVPTHFVLPQMINDDPSRYDRIMDYVRYNAIDVYAPVRQRLVNLGAVPDMDLAYVAKHGGAVYWEAFKASSGNLPKAILNLFRFEMLLDKRFGKTIIQMIKEPQFINHLASPKPEDGRKDIEAMVNNVTGIPNWALLEIEAQFPLLLQDPWWLRYKSLKIGFGEPSGVKGLTPEDRTRISKVIDLAFALHVRISDVFTKPGDTRTFDTHREKVLIEFLRRAFPPVSTKRTFLEHLFIGGVHAVNEFERELRELFKASLARTNGKIAAFGIQGEGNQKEFEIWFHYYQHNFEPAPNVIQRTIMNHLKVPRGRVRVGYKIGQGWFFNSIQRESGVGKRFDTFGTLDHLPDEVELIENVGFLSGLAHCIINGYYGIVNKGTLKETLTVLEFDPKAMDLGNRVDNTMAFVRPDQVQRILFQILDFFPYQPYHYMDCVRLKRAVTEVLVFVNLLKFGRISILYRDNLRTWYCDEFDHAEVFKLAQRLRASPREMLMAKPFHMTLAKFFKSKGIQLNSVALGTWVNPNSVETNHSAGQVAQKEKELAAEFEQIIRRVHGPRQPAAGANGEPGAAPATGANASDQPTSA